MKMFRLFLSLVLVLLLLGGCSDSAREKAAKADLQNAQQQEQQLSLAQALVLYQGVANAYPELPEADEAKAAIVRIEKQQQVKRFRQRAVRILERAATVLDGYYAFSGKVMENLQDLDRGGYMFDSRYLADILPEGTELYLAPGSGGGETRMWFYQSGQSQALHRTLEKPTLTSLNMTELKTLKTNWQEVARFGGLVQVKL